MKTTITLLAISLGALLYAFSVKTDKELSQIPIGKTAPKANLKMKDVSGKNFSLSDLKKSKGLLVIFSCNSCPFVVGRGEENGWEKDYNQLQEICDQQGVGMVLVNSNEAKRQGDDSFEKMKDHAKDKGYASSYVLDEKSALADAFGANKTPHVFLFDGELKLAFKGSIDGRHERPINKTKYLQNAIRQLGQGEVVSPNTTKAYGCSIKRI